MVTLASQSTSQARSLDASSTVSTTGFLSGTVSFSMHFACAFGDVSCFARSAKATDTLAPSGPRQSTPRAVTST